MGLPLCLVTAACLVGSSLAAWESLQVDNRLVDVYVPACVHANSPIILSLHAWATSKDVEKRVDRLANYTSSECAVLVYPQGKAKAEFMGMVGLSWNAGGCCPNANTEGVDDVTFLDNVVAAVDAKHYGNSHLLFVVGISNGGMMANRFACFNDKVKAFVSVSGPLINGTGGEGTEAFDCSRSVPMLHFHGTADTIIPYDGCS